MKQTIIEKLRETYNPTFNYLERVIRSCVTIDQLKSANRWAYGVWQRKTSEAWNVTKSRVNWNGNEDWHNYFDLKRIILGQAISQTEIKIVETTRSSETLHNWFLGKTTDYFFNQKL